MSNLTTDADKIIIDVSYEDRDGDYWMDSHLENEILEVGDKTIHEAITEKLEEVDHVDVSYDGKPQNEVYRDTEEGAKQTGFIYRVKRYFGKNRYREEEKRVLFDAWVEVKGVYDLALESVTNRKYDLQS